MIRLFLILLVFLTPTVSKAEYKWLPLNSLIYADFYNSTLFAKDVIVYYELFNKENTFGDIKHKSSVNLMHLNCVDTSTTNNLVLLYSQPLAKGEVVKEFTLTETMKEESRTYILPDMLVYEAYRNICELNESGGIQLVRDAWLHLHDNNQN